MKTKNIYGMPIYGKGNFNCKYFQDMSKEDKFNICSCPSAKIYMEPNNCVSIIDCSEDYTECVIKNAQNENDIELINKYIDKYSIDGWISIGKKHYDYLIKKLSNNDENYLILLLKYFGFQKVSGFDLENLTDGIVFNNSKR